MNFLLFMWFLASLWQHDLFWAASSNSFDVCLQDTSLESAQRRVKLSSPSVLSGEVGRSPSKFVYVFGRKWGLTVNNPGRTLCSSRLWRIFSFSFLFTTPAPSFPFNHYFSIHGAVIIHRLVVFLRYLLFPEFSKAVSLSSGQGLGSSF